MSPSMQATTGGLWGSNDTTERVGTLPGRSQRAQLLSCSGVNDHLRLQPFVLKPRLLWGVPAPTAGAVPSSQQAPGFPLN